MHTKTSAETGTAALLPPFQAVSPQLADKIAAMESRRGRNHPLDQMRGWMAQDLDALKSLKDTPKIQIAGTNGKGSVSRWLSLMLEAKGKRAGIFTSPHLRQHFERLSLGNVPIDAKEWEQIYDRWSDVFARRNLTMFEIDFWMALDWFSRKKPDVWLMEVGMGGERDATTALEYDLHLITNIGLDHMAFLGDTKEEIAAAKAGIMQKGTPVLTTEKDPVCLQVFQSHAQRVGALLQQAQPWVGQWPDYLPAYQKDNFALALAAAGQLGYTFDEKELADIMHRFFWPGRFCRLNQDPLILLDGAHNLPGVQALADSLSGYHFDVLYFSVLADKQGEQMIDLLRPFASRICLVTFESGRLADLNRLARQQQADVVSLEEMMLEVRQKQRPALICGSLYFAAEVLKACQTADGGS